MACWIAGAAIALGVTGAGRSEESPWSAPIRLYETRGRATRPVLAADLQGDVHLIFVAAEPGAVPIEAPRAIMYARLHDERWSEPVRILAMPGNAPVNFPAATVDESGVLHVTWRGGPLHRLHYSRAPVEAADDPAAWSPPRALSAGGAFGGCLGSDIVAGAPGELDLIYAAMGEGVYHRRSVDAGATWTEPQRVSAVDTEEATDYPRLARDAAGRLHAIWTQFALPAGWPPTGGYYAQSADGGRTWTVPRQLVGESRGSGAIAITAGGDVHVVWNSAISIGERSHQVAAGGGAQWSAPQRIALPYRGGFTGYPALAVDAADRLHLVTALDGLQGAHGVIHHLDWADTGWGSDVLISPGAVGRQAVEWPAMAVSEGNRLRVVYCDDGERLWYTTRTTSAPAAAARAFAPRAIGRAPQWWVQVGLSALAGALLVSRTARYLWGRRCGTPAGA